MACSRVCTNRYSTACRVQYSTVRGMFSVNGKRRIQLVTGKWTNSKITVFVRKYFCQILDYFWTIFGTFLEKSLKISENHKNFVTPHLLKSPSNISASSIHIIITSSLFGNRYQLCCLPKIATVGALSKPCGWPSVCSRCQQGLPLQEYEQMRASCLQLLP